MRVNGLYGHVRRNDTRSLALFAGFVVAFHLLAILALVVPLAMLDPEHAPLYGWTGYLVRWVPIVTVAGGLLFAVQMAWHVRTVRGRTNFRFVDDNDEPRLCRIVEPLVIAAGLPTAYVGVIDSPALNAFACGIRRKDAVLVFTRGLIDVLDDDELAAVAAHEIVHVVNEDIRLIAATNICLDTLSFLQPRRNKRQVNRIWEACSLPILAIALPIMVVLILVVSLLRRLALDGSHLTRLLIASAREFIADAESVRLTQNPSALVSALQRIDGRSAIPGLAAGQDAMMIDGAHQGAFATHPTIAERVAAIVSVTGSMALIAPARRDTRPPELRSGAGFGRRPSATRAARSWLAPASFDSDFNRLGLTWEMTAGAIAAIAVFLWIHRSDLTGPAALARALDPAPMRTFFAMGGEGMRCQMQGIGKLVGLANAPVGCDEASIDKMLGAHRGESNLVGIMAAGPAMTRQETAGPASQWNGTFGNIATAEAQLAEVRRAGCFQTERYSVGDRGLHKVTEVPRDANSISLPRYLALNASAARYVGEAPPAGRDEAILKYFRSRKTLSGVIHRFFGDPGLDVATRSYATAEHQAAIAALRERVAAADFAPALTPLERAEIEALARAPLDFVSCTARRGRVGKDA
ncbi:M48 family metalloprotease [Bradyrhizobium sp. 147]|uniref:M48 family metalloprotease n=1 Tax=unclassified Bradyrhizobium TaxID=2631580 RepID=UPI001FF834A1|nr:MULTISPECIES: M48 family metalloprotease [unclassified Bradyrhizobium]MCK1544082.1 M48 family metalloprotease [Bradyrhizobium sp. 179]MCK1624431.1 M48 family metalloprotease [Bradyrhizobium sp. 160]MCK1679764.1 M48 family metalloprotease [Bradyrhizobium sp. 147]